MRTRARVDANHAQVVQALRSCGWTVIDTSRLGGGFPDLVAARAGRIELIEVKDGKKPLSRQVCTRAELKMYDRLISAGVRIRYVNCLEHVQELSDASSVGGGIGQ